MRLALAFVLLLAVSLGAAAQTLTMGPRQCATPEPTISQALATQRVVSAYRAEGAFERRALESVTVPVAVHVLRSGLTVEEGNVPDAWVEAQIDTLNSAFAGFGVRFALALVNRVDNAEWYEDLVLGSFAEIRMKDALGLDPARVLNLYTASLGLDYLGWATLPELYDEAEPYQGVVLLDQSLPGGDAAPYNLGHTGTHEVGHWLGLYHTFSGGCTASNDGVEDTPQQLRGTSGCPSPPPDSCPTDPGLDPIHNYMDYSDDACMTEFTGGQRTRADAMVATYRPTLVAGGYALATVPRRILDGLFVGVTTTAPLRVTNASRAPITVTGATASGADVVVVGGPRTVAPGEAVLLDLEILPSRPGAVAIQVETEQDVTPELFALEGEAVVPPTARLGAPALVARVIEGADAVERTVTLSNEGGGTLLFELTGLPSWVASAEPSSGAILAGTTAEIVLSFEPGALTPTTYQQPIVIETNDPFRPEVSLALTFDVLLRPEALAIGPIYPNPSRGLVTVPLQLPDDLEVTVEVLDVRGRVVAVLADRAPLAVGYPDLRWDASTAAPGLYVVRARTEAEAVVGRVVILR
ncbi:M43 family zinc metalloprotease [Rubrivirga marina]|uniref:Peptidase M43 pregnancy-associated plasma-A domain-containing protein n=1 Tax=Rubrivirga marina TaxID=1196024 RepID=A0A271J2P8_9BACT|nr:M43 family zinc metalloprotease [Rubrivirga marina]PAP77786.1 hypothetical protein BSZ37_15705 [Rubrivirga marina]